MFSCTAELLFFVVLKYGPMVWSMVYRIPRYGSIVVVPGLDRRHRAAVNSRIKHQLWQRPLLGCASEGIP